MKKRIIAASALALAITVGGSALLSGNVNAASTSTSNAQKTVSSTNGMVKGKGIGQGDHVKLDKTAIAQLLGITAAELETAERAGKSLATIAGEQNVTVQSVIDLVTKQLTAALDEQLAAGTITQTKYDTQKAKLATKATELVNRTFSGKGGPGGQGGPGDRGGRGGHMQLDNAAIAALLGLTADKLETAEHAGKSLATIAGEQNVKVQSVIDLVTKQLTAALDKQLAAGTITQTQYDTQKANLATKATELVNRTFSDKGGPGGRGGRGGHMQLDNAAIAALLGLTADELETAEHAGKSLAAIAGEQNVKVQSVVDLVTKQLTAALDKQLAAGTITQTQYDIKQAKLAAKATEVVNRNFSGKDRGQGRNHAEGDGATSTTSTVSTQT